MISQSKKTNPIQSQFPPQSRKKQLSIFGTFPTNNSLLPSFLISQNLRPLIESLLRPRDSSFYLYSQLLLCLVFTPIRRILNAIRYTLNAIRYSFVSRETSCLANLTFQTSRQITLLAPPKMQPFNVHPTINVRQTLPTHPFMHRFTNGSSYQVASQYSSSKAARPRSHRESQLFGKAGFRYTP